MSESSQIQLLGHPTLSSGGCLHNLTPKQGALVALLLLKGQREVDRSLLGRLLWPSGNRASARHSLSQAIYLLNKLRPGSPLFGGNRDLLWAQGIIADVDALEMAVHSGDWVRAANLYRGEFLAGFDLSCSAEVATWVEERRDHYAAIAASVADNLRLDRRLAEAARLTLRLPGSTCTHPIGGLAADCDLERDSVERSSTPFVGRQREMDRLEHLFLQAMRGKVTGIVVEGEPGIGKTALSQRFARLRAIRGSRVLSAHAYTAEQKLPFGVVVQWLRDIDMTALTGLADGWLDIVRAAFPGLTMQSLPGTSSTERYTLESAVDEYKLLEALRRTFVALSASHPLLLLLDDAHLADSASLRFLHYLSRRSPNATIMFLAAVRNQSSHGNESFVGWRGLERLTVGPLTKEDVATLCGHYSARSSMTESRVEELASRTGGNPLLLVSVLASGDILSCEEACVPDSVIDFFTPQLSALSRNANALLAALSLAGEESNLGSAARIAGMKEESAQLSASLNELEKATLVVTKRNGAIGIRHGIVGEIAISRLSPADRKALYGRAARTLDEEGRSHPAILAVQHDIAGHRSSAFAAALTAATASRHLYAIREQEFFLKLALSTAPDKYAEYDIRIQLAQLYRQTGRADECFDIISESVMLTAAPHQRVLAQACRTAMLLASGQADFRIREKIESLSQALPALVLADLYAALAALCHDHGQGKLTVNAANHALALVSGLPPSPACVMIATRAEALLGLHLNVREGLAALSDLSSAAHNDLETLGRCIAARATLLVAAGDLIEAERAFLRAIELIQRCCMYPALFLVHNNLGVCYTELGRYDQALQQLTEANSICNEFGPLGDVNITTDNRATLHLERGEHEHALRTARTMRDPVGVRSPRALFHRHAVVGLASIELGLVAQAFEAEREIDLLFEQFEFWSSDLSYVETFLARILAMKGNYEAARDRLDDAIETFRPRDLMGLARLELERARLDLKRYPGEALRRSERMVDVLHGTGARPLVDRFDALADRARLRVG